MSSATVPMFSPDGQLGDIPYERMHEAIAAGGKIGVNMLDPQGNPGVIPADRVQDAVKAGGKVQPYNLQTAPDPNQKGFAGTMLGDIFARFQKTPGESIEQSVRGGVMGDKGSQIVKQQTQQDIKSGNMSGMYGHLAAAELPAVMGLMQVSGANSAIGDAIPTTGKAGKLFQQVSAKAGSNPVDVSGAGDAALRAQELAENGGRMPSLLNKFLRRSTNPDKPPIDYDTARDFYSQSGQQSIWQKMSTSPQMKRQIAQFRSSLGDAIQDAANKAGVGEQYSQAMQQYRQAMVAQKLGKYAAGAAALKVLHDIMGPEVLGAVKGAAGAVVP